MSRKHGWLIALVIVALLMVACGPEMATPTPSEKASTAEVPTAGPVGQTPVTTPEKEPVQESVSPKELPVSADDWHVLGSPDAPVTIIEYSEFQ